MIAEILWWPLVTNVKIVDERESSLLFRYSLYLSPGVKNANRARFFASRICGLSRPRSFSSSTRIWISRKRVTKISSNYVAGARAPANSRPNSRRRLSCSLLFRPKDFLSEWRMDEIATLLDRARARARRRISGRLLFCLSAPLLSGRLRWNFDESPPSVWLLARLRRYEIAVRNKKQLKFVR